MAEAKLCAIGEIIGVDRDACPIVGAFNIGGDVIAANAATAECLVRCAEAIVARIKVGADSGIAPQTDDERDKAAELPAQRVFLITRLCVKRCAV